MNKNSNKMPIWKIILKTLLSLDYYLGFWPAMSVYYISRLISKPKCDTDFYKRILYIQAIICPIVFAFFLMVLWRYLNLNLIILFIIIMIYANQFIYVHYKEDQFVAIVNLDEPELTKKFSKKLRNIKIATYYITLFILTVLFPIN